MDIDLDKEDLEKLSDILTIRDEQGRAMLKVGWVVRMFFADPWTRPVREAVSEAAEDYLELVREHLRWARKSGTGRMSPIDKKKVPSPREWLPEYEDGASWSVGYHGGDNKEEASHFELDILGGDEIARDSGYFEAYLPLTWFATHSGTIQDFVLGLAQRLRPTSGYCNVGAQPPQHPDGMRRTMFLVRRLSERLPGLDVGNAISESMSIRRGGIKGASWLTVLGDTHVNEIGGAAYLKMRLGEDFPITPYGGGLMIQAGPKPQIGDVETKRWPRHLVILSKVLQPIRCKRHCPIHGWGHGEDPTMDFDVTKTWLARFDDQ
jgi:hypothetical protein